MGSSKNKKKETGGLQPKGGAYALQDARAAAETINTELLGEGIVTKADAKEAKRLAKQAHKAEVAKVKDKKKEKTEKKKKGNIFTGIKNMGGELKKVRWPGFGQVMKQTGVVLSVVVLFGLIVFGIDRGLGALYDLLMSTLKTGS